MTMKHTKLSFGEAARSALSHPLESGVAYIGAGATAMVAGGVTCMPMLENLGFYFTGVGVERLFNYTDHLRLG